MGGHDLGECLLASGYACSACWQIIRAARQETDEALASADKSPQDDTETTA